MRMTASMVLGLVLLGGVLAGGGAGEGREAHIARLAQEAGALRKQGQPKEAAQRLAEAERVLRGGAAVRLSGMLSPPAALAADAGEEFAAGLAAMSAGDLETAKKKFQAVVAEDPQSFEAHNNLAVILAEQGKEEEALAELREALRLRPDYYRGRKNLAELYARLAGRAFKDAAVLAPVEDRAALLERGRSLAAAGEAAAPPPVAAREVAEAPPIAAPAAPAPPAPAPAAAPLAAVEARQRPRQFLALGNPGSYGMMITGDRLWLYQQQGTDVGPTGNYAITRGVGIPAQDTVYVAIRGASGLVLAPLQGGGPSLMVTASGGGSTNVTMGADDLKAVAAAVEPYLTPVLVTAHPQLVGDGGGAGARPDIAAAFRAWSESWGNKNLARYLASYTADYNPEGGGGHADWKAARERIFARSGSVSVRHSDPVILELGGEAVILARQRYQSNLQVSSGVKRLNWTSTPDGWRISREEMLSERIGG